MTRNPISFDELSVRAHQIFDRQWFVLTCGVYQSGNYNSMVISWGSLGTMWNIPFAHVAVRPTRYTYEFMDEYRTFTLCTFAEEHREAVLQLGTQTGRDGDKIKACGLTVVASQSVDAPTFDEAELVLECRTLYGQDMQRECFVEPRIDSHYPIKDYHRFYYGQVVSIHGTDQYRMAD